MFLFWLRQLPRCCDRTPASVSPPAEGRSSPTNTLVFPLVPSFYWVLYGSIYSFPLLRYSCLLSAGVPRAFLCLKVYSWDICGERCTPHLLTPLPSCSPVCSFGQVKINLLRSLMFKSLYWCRFSFILIKYLSVKWLDHILHVYLRTHQIFSIGVAPLYILTINAQQCQYLHILA